MIDSDHDHGVNSRFFLKGSLHSLEREDDVSKGRIVQNLAIFLVRLSNGGVKTNKARSGLWQIRIAVIMYLNFGVIYDKYKSLRLGISSSGSSVFVGW